MLYLRQGQPAGRLGMGRTFCCLRCLYELMTPSSLALGFRFRKRGKYATG